MGGIPASSIASAAKGQTVLVQAWAPTEDAARAMMRAADGWGTGLNLELGGVFGWGWGPGVGEAEGVTYRLRSYIPRATPAWVGSGVAEVTGEIDAAGLRATAQSHGGAFIVEAVDAPAPSTYRDFVTEAPALAADAAKNLASGIGSALGAGVESFGVGKALMALAVVAGVGAFVVFGLPRLAAKVLP